MTRIRLKGVHRVVKRNKDGSTRAVYWYAWRGGPRIPDPRMPEGLAAYQTAHAERRRTGPGTVAWLVEGFLTERLPQVGPSTADRYRRALDSYRAAFGSMPFAAAMDPRARRDFKAWRDGFRETPRAADANLNAVSAMWSWAKAEGYVSRNPVEGIRRLSHGTRRDATWTPADLARLEAAAPPEVWRVVRLAYATALRRGDLLAMTWSAWDGQRIRLVQRKTKRPVAILMDADTARWLDEMRANADSTHVLLDKRGRPWGEASFHALWQRTVKAAGIEGLTFHDLRGSRVTADVLAGATVEEVTARYGWSRHEATTTLDRHYLGPTHALGDRVVALRREK